ncbi:hypothetical protein F4778DRAFT_750222 [Xylariomycetidae sp. FL2044]|nr:hypothetical protein F4778DRAFT_750222 [Xylariomycetidae sp. FL2044]
MPSPFVCRRCIARLSKAWGNFSTPRRSRIHTALTPAPGRPPLALIPFEREQHPSHPREPPEDFLSRAHEVDDLHNDSPKVQNAEGEVEEEDEEYTHYWDGTLKRFVVRRRPHVRAILAEPLATSVDALKGKIWRAGGDYGVALQDLMHCFALSRQEARHAVGQLKRLLWAQTTEEKALRVDIYCAWKSKLSPLLAQYVPQSPSELSEGRVAQGTPSNWHAFSEQDAAQLKATWERLDPERRRGLWPEAVVSAYTSNSAAPLAFIRAVFDPSWCPSYVIEDVVYILLRQGAIHQDNMHLLIWLLEHCPPRYLAMEQEVLHKIATLASLPELERVYETLKQTEHPLLPNAMLHFASRFAKSTSHKTQAVQVIYSLADIEGFDLNRPAPASVCTSLLHLDKHDSFPDGEAAPDVLLKVLLDCGFRPNLITLSALMHNFCLRGSFETAWEILDLLVQHGIEPDAHVYSILLDGLKERRDMNYIERIIEMIESRNAWTSVHVNNLLDILFVEHEAQPEHRRRQKKKTNPAWVPSLHLYAKFFDLAPLQKFVAFPLENVLLTKNVRPQFQTPFTRLLDTLEQRPEMQLMKPDGATLNIMIRALLRSMVRPHFISAVYGIYRQHRTNHESYSAAMAKQGTALMDTFVRALMQFGWSMRHALGVVETMIADANQEKERLGYNVYCHPPSVKTWNAMMNGFKNHRSTNGALSILNLMQEDGSVTPNLTTWNILVALFSSNNDIHNAVKALWHMEQAGYKPDERTLQALSRMSRVKRDKVVEMLEKFREQSRHGLADVADLDLGNEKHAGARERNTSWSRKAMWKHVPIAGSASNEAPEPSGFEEDDQALAEETDEPLTEEDDQLLTEEQWFDSRHQQGGQVYGFEQEQAQADEPGVPPELAAKRTEQEHVLANESKTLESEQRAILGMTRQQQGHINSQSGAGIIAQFRRPGTVYNEFQSGGLGLAQARRYSQKSSPGSPTQHGNDGSGLVPPRDQKTDVPIRRVFGQNKDRTGIVSMLRPWFGHGNIVAWRRVPLDVKPGYVARHFAPPIPIRHQQDTGDVNIGYARIGDARRVPGQNRTGTVSLLRRQPGQGADAPLRRVPTTVKPGDGGHSFNPPVALGRPEGLVPRSVMVQSLARTEIAYLRSQLQKRENWNRGKKE